MKAILIEKTGGPDVLQFIEQPTPAIGPGQALVRHEAIGLNFIDIYVRTGLYPSKLPLVLGNEAAGEVEAVGEGVTRVKPGDRVAYAQGAGAYADYNVVAANRLVHVPDGITLHVAAAALLKGMTAEFLAERVAPTLKPGDTVLLHAAAGGVGAILTQWLKHRELKVIATAGGERKGGIALSHGADHVIDYNKDDVAERVRGITNGAGVSVVFDSVGQTTFEASLASLRKRGLMVCFGNASGPAPAIEPGRLSRLGSLFLTRPTLFDYVASTAELDASAKALFDLIENHTLKIDVAQTWPLADARKAHEALESRMTTGASLLIP